MKLLSTYIQNLSLKKKIYYIVLICIVMLALVSLISIKLIATSYQKVLYRSIASSLSYSSVELENSLTNINTMADMFLANSSVQKNLSLLKDSDNTKERNEANQSLYTTLNEYCFNYRKNNIQYMSLYQGNFSTHAYWTIQNPLPDSVKQDLMARAAKGKGANIWITDYSQEYGIFMVKDILRIQHLKLDSIGILIVNIDLEAALSKSTAFTRTFENASFLLYDQEQMLFDSSGLSHIPDFNVSTSLSTLYGSLSYKGKNLFYVRGKIPNYHWDYVYTIPYDSISSTLTFSRNLCLLMILTAVILALILSSRLIVSITRHFDNLVMKMQSFGEQKILSFKDECDYHKRLDELGILHIQFDKMVDKVNELIRSNYLNEILRKEAQIKALETQINPHFLYNTLESINWRAKALGSKEISATAESLGTLLRITLDQHTKQFPLYRELELIQCYMTIQKLRYQDRLQFVLSVPDDLLHFEVLKLTLQPLVENAIRYGLEKNTGPCSIQLLAESRDNFLYLYVKNDGSFFEDDLLPKMKLHRIKPHGFGIGLLNIHERLQLTYGNQYGLTLYNEDEIAVARLAFPISYDNFENNKETTCNNPELKGE